MTTNYNIEDQTEIDSTDKDWNEWLQDKLISVVIGSSILGPILYIVLDSLYLFHRRVVGTLCKEICMNINFPNGGG